MRLFTTVILLIGLFTLTAGAEDFHVGQPCLSYTTTEYVPGQVVVKFKDGVGFQKASTALADLGATMISSNEAIGIRQLAIPADKTVEEMVAAFSARPDVEYA